MAVDDALISHLEGLRECYPQDNRVGLLLDELLSDLRSGAPREEVVADARAIEAELGPMATASKAIGRVLTALNA